MKKAMHAGVSPRKAMAMGMYEKGGMKGKPKPKMKGKGGAKRPMKRGMKGY